ncbi:MAG TPA: response regulator [Nitrospiraceae bacterium]|nr:response regulator [Nitrospiraceae bacterium]
MPQANILVVEDEPIVAKDIQVSLQRLGYGVPAMASSGEDAIRKTGESHPDLILMDIVLKGKMDGVETVRQIRKQYDVPVIYLTAYADDHTLERAKTTAPAGYMLKPYQPNELRTTIELALHRARHDQRVHADLRWLATTVRCIGDGVMTTDRHGRITYVNPAAEGMTGWNREEASGVGVDMVMGPRTDDQPEGGGTLALKAMAESRAIPFTKMAMIDKHGTQRWITGTVAPVIDDAKTVIGSVWIFRVVVDPPPRPHESDAAQNAVRDIDMKVGRAEGIINLCAWCKRVPDSCGGWYDLTAFIAEQSGLEFNGGLCPECMARCFPSDVSRSPNP